MPIDPSNFAEIGFAGLSAVLLFGVFRWMTGELNKKIDDLHQIIIKLIDSKNALKDSINEDITELMKSISHLDDETTNHLNYIESKLGNGRGSKQRRKSSGEFINI